MEVDHALDSTECIIRAISLKSHELGVEEKPSYELRRLTSAELLVKIAKHHLRILPNPHECHVELRKAVRPHKSLCSLAPAATGMCACFIGRERKLITHSCATYYGSSVLASQMRSLSRFLPRTNQIWTIGNTGGKVGALLGHAGMGSCFISDPCPKRLHSHQINNGPLELFNDRCQESYDWSYYMESLKKVRERD